MSKKYDFQKIEPKWQKVWQKERVYEPSFAPTVAKAMAGKKATEGKPDFKKAKRPFYNLMMFPYPSAEGLHVGNMYAFTGSDIYGRFKRMQGYDVFEPIGLDGFGIHSENYALKIGVHPMKQAKISEKRFCKQLEILGNGFAWDERLETYDPNYYKWTQWIFVQMFKNGLAYRKKQAVNWCPSCKTVLADEQVIQMRQGKSDMGQGITAGVCERCNTKVIKKELEQWFFRITKYAERLLNNLEYIDWSEKVKIAQRNWIGKSEGAEIDFELKTKANYVLLHGYTGSPTKNFFPWLKKELEKRGAKVYIPKLPNSDDPRVADQVIEALKTIPFDKNTVLVGHSLGGVVALKILEQLKEPVRKTVLAASFCKNTFITEPFGSHTFNWKFDLEKIKANAGELRILRDTTDDNIPQYQADNLKNLFGGTIYNFVAKKPHACGDEEPEVLRHCINSISVFTTRPDTLFGATYMVLAPEHKLVSSIRYQVSNWKEVENYIKKAAKKSEEDRIAEGKTKTGVELKGIKAINPANKEEIPVWVADYVLMGYGTGAIMAVPAHDERDWEFAKKYKLPVKMVVCPHYPAKTCPILDAAYEGEGHLVDSGKFHGKASEEAKREITEFVGGRKKIHYRLRDWLISRQRYWGPPIPLVFCEHCAARINADDTRINADNIGENLRSNRRKSAFTRGELENPGWIAVPENDLPVRLPFAKNFQPKGKGESPLGTVKSFYETRCPKCKGKARRETDVSDTFLDSAWYYLGYLILGNQKSPPKADPPQAEKIKNQNDKLKLKNQKFVWDGNIVKKWLPVDMYIGGAEHAVLHLFYSRFFAMAFYDFGLIQFEEPFKKFRAHGLLIKEGAKMSKSKGNVVNPDEYIRKFGADTFRMYLMFLAPFDQGGDFRDAGILGIKRFLERVWRLYSDNGHGTLLRASFALRRQSYGASATGVATKAEQGFGGQASYKDKLNELDRLTHQTIKKVTEDIENLHYNTAVSAMMILLNKIEETNPPMSHIACRIFPKLLAPFAPHITEELWQQTQINADKDADKRGYIRANPRSNPRISAFRSIHLEPWPVYDPKLIEEKTFTLIIQVNGKVRDTLSAPAEISEQDAQAMARDSEKIKKVIDGKKVVKIIYVPRRLVNIVTGS